MKLDSSLLNCWYMNGWITWLPWSRSYLLLWSVEHESLRETHNHVKRSRQTGCQTWDKGLAPQTHILPRWFLEAVWRTDWRDKFDCYAIIFIAKNMDVFIRLIGVSWIKIYGKKKRRKVIRVFTWERGMPSTDFESWATEVSSPLEINMRML